jgi:hypothetical protein
MVALLEVFRLDSNSSTVGVWINSVDSLLEALNIISEKGCGEYMVYSPKTGRRRFYSVNGDGKIAFWKNEELTLPTRYKLKKSAAASCQQGSVAPYNSVAQGANE